MAERFVLDPADVPNVTHGRAFMDITPWVDADGIDWGDAQIAATMAEQLTGSAPVDFTVPARQITIPLNLRTVGGTTFADVRGSLQAKIGLWQQQGGWLRRTSSGGGTVFCDVTNATLKLGGGWGQANRDYDTDAVVTLEAVPDFYQPEEQMPLHTESTNPELMFVESTTDGGDFPLGDRCRVNIDNLPSFDQRGMFWHFRGRNYSSEVTALPAYAAGSLTALDTATKAAKNGATTGTAVTHGTVSTNWTPIVGTNISGTYMTHTGSYNVWARCLSADGTAVSARFVWDVGDLVYPTENDPVTLYDGGTFQIMNLGEIRLDRPANTTGYRWQGQVQARSTSGTSSFSCDRIWFQNLDESAGFLSAPLTFARGLSTFTHRSEFNTETAGTINGKTLAVGGTWSSVSGTAGDYNVTGGYCTRTVTNDPDLDSGRFANPPTNLTATAAQLDFALVTSPDRPEGVTGQFGLTVRFTGQANQLRVVLRSTAATSQAFEVIKRVSSNDTVIGSYPFTIGSGFYTINAIVDATGRWAAWLYPQGGNPGQPLLSGRDGVLATGGALDSGRPGIYDVMTFCDGTRAAYYDNFAAWVPNLDAVAFADQSVELNTRGMVREDAGGTAYGPITQVTGDLPRMPNRSSAGTVEFMMKLSRGDLQYSGDTNIENVRGRIYRMASYLTLD